jgi:hypothetical protein
MILLKFSGRSSSWDWEGQQELFCEKLRKSVKVLYLFGLFCKHCQHPPMQQLEGRRLWNWFKLAGKMFPTIGEAFSLLLESTTTAFCNEMNDSINYQWTDNWFSFQFELSINSIIDQSQAPLKIEIMDFSFSVFSMIWRISGMQNK